MRTAALLLALVVALPAHPRTRVVRVSLAEDPATWLRQNAVDLDEVSAIADAIGSARIVALGDVTHGTHELYVSKVRLIQHLVLHRGFRTIAFEAPFGEFEIIREYVLTGRGDPAAALQSPDYFFWDTDEVLELIEWARAQNANGLTPPVEIRGIDTVHPHPVMDRVVAAAPTSLRDEIERRYDCLASYAANPWNYSALAPSGQKSCRDSIAAVRPLLAANSASDELLRAARIVEQGEETLGTGYAAREPFMAENLLWLASRGKVVTWGHNEHLGRLPHTIYSAAGTKSTGTYLAEALGDEYFVAGSTALQGTFWGMQFSGGIGVIREQTMTTASSTDIAAVLRAARNPAMFVPLRGPIPNWLATPRPIRLAGANVPTPQRATTAFTQDLARKFDALVYVETSTPTKLRHFPLR